MSDWTWTKAAWRGCRASLTRALNTKDPERILKAVRKAVVQFNQRGWPDSWARWRVAYEDAKLALQRQGKTAEPIIEFDR